METLGHSKISTTINIYGHLIPAMRRDAVTRMNALFTRELQSSSAD